MGRREGRSHKRPCREVSGGLVWKHSTATNLHDNVFIVVGVIVSKAQVRELEGLEVRLPWYPRPQWGLTAENEGLSEAIVAGIKVGVSVKRERGRGYIWRSRG